MNHTRLMPLAIALICACTRAPHREVAPEGASSEAVNNARHPPPDKQAPVNPSAIEPLPSGTAHKPAPAPEAAADAKGTPAEVAPPNAAVRQAPSSPKTKSAIGTNLDQIADWSPEQAMVDIFKTSRRWISGSDEQWQDQRPINVDGSGWVRSLLPGQYARTTMLWDGVPFTSGNYLVLTEGEGTVEYHQPGGAKEVVQHRGAGRHVLALDPSRGGVSLTIQATNPSDPLRNIRVLMPGGVCAQDPQQWCSESTPCSTGACTSFENLPEHRFNPIFLEKIRGYSVLRFMDWMNTNDDKPVAWANRPKLTDARWSDRGAPVELMVELANRSGKDPWFCMSHLANDDYVTRFAAYVRDHLKGGLKAHVEYSNEVWNGTFPQADHARQLGLRSRLGKSDFEAQMRLYARRATQVMKLWERAFNGPSRLVRVMASQASNAWVSKQILQFEDTAKHADALAIAPYFGGGFGNPEQEKRVERMSVDQLFGEIRTKALPDAARWVAEQAKVAKEFSVDLIAYEGGQHLAGIGSAAENDKINALFDAANRDPRMRDVYAKYLADWRKNGGKLFVHFSSCARMSKWGRWGALESLLQRRGTAPKFDALQDFIQKNPPWW
jgi:hypothetical protein